jgi:cytosine/adenosine deaminase-related metal-dependent hydrolase
MPTAYLTNALLPDGRAAHIGITAGRIAEIRSAERPVDESAAAMDVGGALVLPGFVDGHLHLRRAMLIGWRSNFRRDEELLAAFDMVTAAGAQAHGLAPYGLTVGAPADLCAVAASGIPEAIAAALNGLRGLFPAYLIHPIETLEEVICPRLGSADDLQTPSSATP